MNAPVRIPGQPAPAGDNSGAAEAEPTPFMLSRDRIDAIHMEAGHWLSGAAITSEEEAEAVKRISDLMRAAAKEADERRAAEKQPHDDAAKAVQERFNPLIAGVFTATKSAKGKAKLVLDACSAALTPWNEAKLAARRAEAEARRREAEEAKRDAALAFQLSDASDLAAREEAEQLAREAKEAERAAKKAERPVATGLRAHVRARVIDRRAFLNWAAANRPDELAGMLQTLAERLSDAKVRGLPGVTYTEEHVAR